MMEDWFFHFISDAKSCIIENDMKHCNTYCGSSYSASQVWGAENGSILFGNADRRVILPALEKEAKWNRKKRSTII